MTYTAPCLYVVYIFVYTRAHNTQRFIRVFRAVQDTFQDKIPVGAGAKNIKWPRRLLPPLPAHTLNTERERYK